MVANHAASRLVNSFIRDGNMWFEQTRKKLHRQIDKPVVKCAYSRHRYLASGSLMAEMLLNEELFRGEQHEAEAEV